MTALWIAAIVFSCCLAVLAMYLALNALDSAQESVREARIRAGVDTLAADLGLLFDTVARQGESLRKIRNRNNAANAREAKKNGRGPDLSDDEFLKAVEQGKYRQ